MRDLLAALACCACVALAGRARSLAALGPALPASVAPERSTRLASVARLVPRLRGFVQGAEAAQARDRAVLDALHAIGETLRSGGSLDLALATVGRDVAAPVGPAFRSMHERLAMGVPFDDALARWEREVRGDEAHLLAATLRMHHRSGGSLSAVLANLADAVRDRLDVAAEIRALTAQARLSAWIVGSLPVGFLCFLTLISGPSFLGVFVTPAGIALLVIGAVLQVAAVVWIRRILSVEP